MGRALQLVILFIIEGLLILEHISEPSQGEINPNTLGVCLFLVIISIFTTIFQNNPPALKGQIITISFVFLFSFFVVHFINYIGWELIPNNYEFLNKSVVTQACVLSSASFVACLIGNALCTKPFKGKVRQYGNTSIGRVPIWIMALFMTLFILFTDARYFSAGGNSAVLNEIGWNPIGAASYNICVAVVIANVISVIVNYHNISHKNLTIKKYINLYPLSFYFLTVIFLAIVLVSGDRGPMMDIIISYCFGYVILKRHKPNIAILILLGIFCIFILKYLSFLRGNPDTLSIDKISVINDRLSAFHDENLPIIGDIRELSDVVNAYHLVYGFVQNNFIIYGVGIIIQILAIFPGIRYFIMELTGIPPAFYSTDQLATVLLGEDYGAGTTCVADAYYNFGFWGTIVFFLCVGYFLRKLDLSIYQKYVKLFVLTLGICFFTKAIYLGRSYFLQPVTLIVYTYLILILTKYINKHKTNGTDITSY